MNPKEKQKKVKQETYLHVECIEVIVTVPAQTVIALKERNLMYVSHNKIAHENNSGIIPKKKKRRVKEKGP